MSDHRPLTSLVAAAAALALAGACDGPDTVLLVVVEGPADRPVALLEVAVTVGADTRMMRVPESPGAAFALPASFTVQIPRSRSGSVSVSVVARDGGGGEIGRGTAMLLTLVSGANQELTVILGQAPSPPDGGTGDTRASDASGDARGADAAPDAVSDVRAPDNATPSDAADRGADAGVDTADAGTDAADGGLDASDAGVGDDAAADDAGNDAPSDGPADGSPDTAGADGGAADGASDAGDAAADGLDASAG